LAGWFQQLGSAGGCHNYTMQPKGITFAKLHYVKLNYIRK